MSNDLGSLKSIFYAWAMAVVVGGVAFLMLLVLGEFAFAPAAFMALLLTVLVGGVLTWALRPLPRFGEDRALRGGWAVAKAASAGRSATPAPAPTAAPAPAAAAPDVAPAVHQPPVAPDGRPELLAAPRGGKPDDLKEIKGVGPKLEELLHRMGVYHFDQIASWRPAEVAWVDANLEAFKGRVARDNWVDQARILAAGGSTEHSLQVQRGEAT